jgi:hypothetical protein
VGVLEEKNASQFALIAAASAPDEPAGDDADDDGGDEAADDAGDPLDPGPGLFPELPPQAVRSRPSPVITAGSARTRRVVG